MSSCCLAVTPHQQQQKFTAHRKCHLIFFPFCRYGMKRNKNERENVTMGTLEWHFIWPLRKPCVCLCMWLTFSSYSYRWYIIRNIVIWTVENGFCSIEFSPCRRYNSKFLFLFFLMLLDASLSIEFDLDNSQGEEKIEEKELRISTKLLHHIFAQWTRAHTYCLHEFLWYLHWHRSIQNIHTWRKKNWNIFYVMCNSIFSLLLLLIFDEKRIVSGRARDRTDKKIPISWQKALQEPQ